MEKHFVPIILEMGEYRVSMDDIGEGIYGDYDPDDEQDERRLRFYCDKFDRAYGEWVDVEDASYCTLFTPEDKPITLLKFMLLIFEVLESGEGVKRNLEWLTHKTAKDLE